MKHCLIIDDSAVVRKVARRILEAMAFRISEAEDGEQALALCRNGMPDVVFVDEIMPGMDGYAFLKALRRVPDGTAPKVVFCTTATDAGQIARAKLAGADQHMLKPFDRDTIAATLEVVGLH